MEEETTSQNILFPLILVMIFAVFTIGVVLSTNAETCEKYDFYKDNQHRTNETVESYRPNTVNLCPSDIINIIPFINKE